MGINKVVVNFDVEGIETKEYIIFVYDKLRKRYKGKEYIPLYLRLNSKMEATL